VKALLVDLDGTIMNSTSAIVKGRCKAGGERDYDGGERISGCNDLWWLIRKD
jgi:beta-phosphoglucomutase-like phosphatase (HAD superfamily)